MPKGFSNTPEETSRKMSEARMGTKNHMWGKKRVFSDKWKENMSKSHTGLRHTDETKIKIGLKSLGNKRTLGKKNSLETRIKKSLAQKGERGSNWQGGIAQKNHRERTLFMNSLAYKLWREAVYLRDKFTCVLCNQKGVKLNADHIKPYSTYPELRLEISNGRTLCEPCHRETDTYGSRPIKTTNQAR